jgi:hypothetical protein
MVSKPLQLQARRASATSLVAVVGTGLMSAVNPPQCFPLDASPRFLTSRLPGHVWSHMDSTAKSTSSAPQSYHPPPCSPLPVNRPSPALARSATLICPPAAGARTTMVLSNDFLKRLTGVFLLLSAPMVSAKASAPPAARAPPPLPRSPPPAPAEAHHGRPRPRRRPGRRAAAAAAAAPRRRAGRAGGPRPLRAGLLPGVLSAPGFFPASSRRSLV